MQRVIDQLLGCWIRDVVYQSNDNKRKYSRPMDNSIDKHLNSDFSRIKHNCGKLIEIQNGFTFMGGQPLTIIKNGQGFYKNNNIHKYIAPPKLVVSMKPTPLIPINNKWHPIFHLLCGNITNLVLPASLFSVINGLVSIIAEE